MPESVSTIFYQQIKEEEMKVKQIMNSTGSTINKEVNLAQNLSKTLKDFRKEMQKVNRSGKKKKRQNKGSRINSKRQ